MLQEVDGHPHILQLDDFYYSSQDETKDRHLHIVSELMSENLATYIKRMKKRLETTGISFEEIPVQKVRLYAKQLFEALVYTHGKGIIHRDVKPANILLDSHKKNIKLCDWGSAK
jgi:serine/threonine protein kinase